MRSPEHAAAESDFFDVFEIPSVLVLEGDSEVLARWDGSAPRSEELHEVLEPLKGRSSAAA